MWKCPECHETIEYLRYSVRTEGSEWGSAYLSKNSEDNDDERITDHDFDDSESDGWSEDPSYECPECDASIHPSDLEWENNDEDEDEDKAIEEVPRNEEEIPNIIKPTKNIFKDTSNQDMAALICKECRHLFVATNQNEWSTEIVNCPKSDNPNTYSECKKLLEKGFFSKIKQTTCVTTGS